MENNKINFTALVRQIKTNGGFDFYDQTPIESLDIVEGLIKVPLYPGDRAFIGQVASTAKKMKVAQSVINAHRKSIHEALKFYMPPDVMSAFQQTFISTDFLRNTSFKNLLRDSFFPSPFYDEDSYLPDELTGKWEAPERNHIPHRVFYTKQDIFITKEVCTAVPEIVISILAFQSSFIEYVQNLRKAIINDTEFLTDAERNRGSKVIHEGLFQWQSDTFIKKFLPSVTGHYYQNHNGDLSEPPTEQDFHEGMKWPVRKGVFAHDVGGNRINCPASKTVLHAATITIPSDKESPKHMKLRGLGAFPYSLYQACKRQFAQDKSLKDEIYNILEHKIYFFTSKESEIVYRENTQKGRKMLTGKSLPIKPKVYIAVSNSLLDRALMSAVDLDLSFMRQNRLIDIDNTAVNNAEECIKRMEDADIVLLMISEDFINSNWGEQVIENARELNKSSGKLVIPVMCSNVNEQIMKKVQNGMNPIFSSDKPLYNSSQFYTPHQLNNGELSNIQGLALSGLLRGIVKGYKIGKRSSDEV